MDDTMELELKMTLGDMNFILARLGKLPFEEVAGIIKKLVEQAQKQIADAQA